MAADRAVVSALRRLHRRDPLRPAFRLDAVLAEVGAASRPAAAGHRGGSQVALDAAGVDAALARLAAGGTVRRDGRRVSLAEHVPELGGEMRARVDRLLNGLRETGAAPPRVDGIAARLGVPGGVLDALRSSGELVAVAPGIDYPRDVLAAIDERIDALAASGPLTVPRVRDALRTTRRHVEALLARRRARRAARRGRRQVRSPRPGA